MSRILVKLRRGEKGQALLLTMILLLVGSLIVVSILIYMGSGVKVGKDVHEERMAELYAADAGVEDALWQIHEVERLKQLIEKVDGVTLPDDWMPEDYPEEDWPITYEAINDMNRKKVEVEIDYLPSSDSEVITFNIKSVATQKDAADPKSTTIDAHASGLNFDLLGNAITSRAQVEQYSEVYDGDVVYCSEIEPKDVEDHVHGVDAEVVPNCDVDWPEAELFSEIYLDQVLDDPDHEVNDGEPITLISDQSMGPLYVNGDLTINSETEGVTLTLEGTVYVTGKLFIGDSNKAFTLNLNGQTIFVKDGTIKKDHYAALVGGRTEIGNPNIPSSGTGCLIAVGNIEFKPNMNQGVGEDFMFVFSIEGATQAYPNGSFNGSFAGNVDVHLYPGDPSKTELRWNNPYDNDLNFPMGGYWNDKFYAQIDAWEINLD